MNELDILKQQWQNLNAAEENKKESKDSLQQQIKAQADTAWGKLKKFSFWDSTLGMLVFVVGMIASTLYTTEIGIKIASIALCFLIIAIGIYNLYFLRWADRLFMNGDSINETYSILGKKLRRNYNITCMSLLVMAPVIHFISMLWGMDMAMDADKEFTSKMYLIALGGSILLGPIYFVLVRKYLLEKFYLPKIEAIEEVNQSLV
ncbi:hypothetical protein [Sediminitomix flava]|uniref:Uncharacterized protein n=1 Tax=Sediminitomix flava TaxID=379075 RepID=A0A315ZCQ6_SEDFL|nr:hypothetical protein [Sediminitomix flava]PWJ43331.1 hypothetical protein BC781_102888 [Sediminitomix flava]